MNRRYEFQIRYRSQTSTSVGELFLKKNIHIYKNVVGSSKHNSVCYSLSNGAHCILGTKDVRDMIELTYNNVMHVVVGAKNFSPFSPIDSHPIKNDVQPFMEEGEKFFAPTTAQPHKTDRVLRHEVGIPIQRLQNIATKRRRAFEK